MVLLLAQISLPQVKSQQTLNKQATSKSLGGKGDETDEDENVDIHIHELPKAGRTEKRRLLVHHAMETEEQNNLRLLTKIRERMER